MILYRYEKYCTDEFLANADGTHNVELYLQEYEVTRETPTRYYFMKHSHKETWTGKDTHRRFAHRTKEGALKSFIHRCKRSIDIMEHHILFTKLALDRARETK